MDTPTLSDHITPAIYLDDVVTQARAGALESLSIDLLIVRLCFDLTEDNIISARQALDRLQANNLEGWPLYQVATAAIFLAIKMGEPSAIVPAIDAWMTGMATYPENWQIGVLQAPEVKPWLTGFAPERLRLPAPSQKRPMTDKERAFIQAPETFALRAVNENLVWFHELGVSESAQMIATWYEPDSVNLQLKECYLETTRDLPTIVVALDADGAFVGSFFLH
jgi:hypothetical protein